MKEYITYKTHILLSYCLLIFSIAFLLISEMYDIEDSVYSIFYSLIFAISFLSRCVLAKESLYSFYSLYIYTFYIFVLGSFFSAWVIGMDIFQRDIFGFITVENKSRLMMFVLVFYFSCEAGYFYNNRKFKISNYPLSKPVLLRFTVFVIVFFFGSTFFLIQINFNNIYTSLNSSYMHSFESGNTSKSGTPTELILYMINNVSLGIAAMISRDKPRLFKIVLYVFVLNSVMTILGGGRSMAISAIFVLLYIVNQKNDRFSIKNLMSFFIITFSVLLLLNYAMTFTSRAAYTELTIYTYIAKFLYDQGSTLLVINASMNVDSYPVMPYLKTFFPFLPAISNLLTSIDYYPYEINFAHYLAWSIDSSLYSTGRGLGWSLLSDIYLYSLRNVIFFAMLSFLFGKAIKYLSNHSNVTYGLLISIAPVFFTINRASISTLIPMVILYLLVFNLLKIKNGNY
ncbi:O-antigen polysaccharide polymerase Wzy [Vibrio cyclitrophicus]|uniref:O-antigen polysaccharide polymerase Wzy n=1 Tax=Vibrio cyclitrophicus TaxID=47951 RepID=UPI0016A4E4F9|nr:O-antigen polysaccharide polymerase Wzy [Vibrio cyclitrophicus]NOI36285.1 O-antigen polysaccharide polymerase Wzy [Vibrio cyclitrophicus]